MSADALDSIQQFLGKKQCSCKRSSHTPQLIVVTGGPGAGKTAVMKLAQQSLCHHVAFIPEAASLVFGGGFWRLQTNIGRKTAQRAIYHVQRQMELLFESQPNLAACICDRGTIDGVAYWPDSEESFWADLHTTKEEELKKYAAVIHMQTPSLTNGYNHKNPLRIEDAKSAAKVDELLLKVWEAHPRRFIVPSKKDFLQKASITLENIRSLLPDCCDIPS